MKCARAEEPHAFFAFAGSKDDWFVRRCDEMGLSCAVGCVSIAYVDAIQTERRKTFHFKVSSAGLVEAGVLRKHLLLSMLRGCYFE